MAEWYAAPIILTLQEPVVLLQESPIHQTRLRGS